VLGRMASREWFEVGRFLGPSIRGFYERHPLQRIVGYWQQAGLQDVRVRRMSLGGGIVMSATKRTDGEG
jgi:demethylmenaquinone methyltransferase/2-methoxy-6-polyprenyl-1,4-benzoquinol methylase